MNKDLIKLLCCPNDSSDLTLLVLHEESDMVSSGLLICPACEDAWAVIHGIPRFVSASSIDLNLEYELLDQHKAAIDAEYPSIAGKMLDKLDRFEVDARNRTYDWNEDELLFWEENYKNRLQNDESNGTSYNRLLPRKKFILDPLLNEDISTILEVGCGTCGTLYHSKFPIQEKQYIGTDISFNALRVAQKFLDANFVMCDAMNLPFKDRTFDLILSFGLMHHLEKKDHSLKYFFKKLKSDGYVGFTEKLKSKFDLKKSRLIRYFKSRLNKEERGHGDDEYIDENSAMQIVHSRGRVISERYEYSIVRDVLTKLMVDRLRINSKILTKVIMKLDYFVIDYLGWLTPLLKGHALILLAKSEESHMRTICNEK